MRQCMQGHGESIHAGADDLLACGYSTLSTGDSSSATKAFAMGRDQFPFCHVMSSGQVAVYWTHDFGSQGLGMSL